MNLYARIAKLEATFPDDPGQLCCLEAVSLQFYRGQGGNPYPPFDFDAEPNPPVELPALPLNGVCQKTGGPLCDFACERAALVWTRRRRLAITTFGLNEDEL